MKKFTTAVNGYNKNEVNEFVSEVIKEYESLLDKLKNRDQEIAALKEKLGTEEADLIIAKAKKNASRIINNSLTEAAKTDAEVAALKEQIRQYKANIKKTITEQLTMVDDIDKVDF